MPTLDSITVFVETYGYLAILGCMYLEGLCVPVPSELLLGFAGFLVYQGKLSFAGAVGAGWLGSFAGSCTIYAAARKGGRVFLYRWGHLVGLSPARLDLIAGWFGRYGPPVIIPWRQIPVLRTKISIAAGLLDMRPWIFAANTAVGIAVWCLLAVSFGYYFGQNWWLFVDLFSRLGKVVIAAVIAAAGAGAVALFLYLRRRRQQETPH